jgi:hypothetical protein
MEAQPFPALPFPSGLSVIVTPSPIRSTTVPRSTHRSPARQRQPELCRASYAGDRNCTRDRHSSGGFGAGISRLRRSLARRHCPRATWRLPVCSAARRLYKSAPRRPRACGPLGQKCRRFVEKLGRPAADIGDTQGHGLHYFGWLSAKSLRRSCNGKISACIVMPIHRSRPKIASGHNRECVRFRDRDQSSPTPNVALTTAERSIAEDRTERAHPWHPDPNDRHT